MSEVIGQMFLCFVAGVIVTRLMDLIRDLIVSRGIKRDLKRAMAEYADDATVEKPVGIESARCTCDGCRARADVAAARATLDTNEGNQP